jgi:hypothetical protein
MLKITFVSVFIFFWSSANQVSQYLPPRVAETIPVDKTVFKLIEKNHEEILDLTGKDFILVSLREPGSDGRFYAVDKDGTVWWSGPASTGMPEFKSPTGIFPILDKKRYHMSTEYPEESGINNMNYKLKFTHQGHAMHEGSVDLASRGCIHIDPRDIPTIYNWVTLDTKVLITRHSYMPFAKEDLKKIYSK